jgi:proline dehydrogenase
MSLARAFVIKTSALPPVEKLVRRSFLFKPLVGRFIAGDTLEEALKASEQLLAKGMKVSLDYLGENTLNEAEALAAKHKYIEMLERIALVPAVQEWDAKRPSPIEPLNISIKLTQCGLDQGLEFAEGNYREVLECAKRLGNFVRIDMESSDYTQRTLDMIEKVLPEYPNTGTVLQSYLFRNDADVETIIRWQARVRLVKGAYLEPATVAFKEKAKVDEAYVKQAKRLLDAGNYPAIATQDEKIITELNQYVAEKKIPKERFEYQMLYGIRRDLQDRLTAEGYNVRIYVPYGDSWYPYFTRRLAERPANAFFILKSLFKG